MNKIKVSKAEMRKNYYIVSIGYCGANYLLRDKTPIAYSCGVYGWSCDYYSIKNVIISTGYAPLKGKNVKNDYELLREYEEKAKEVYNSNLSYNEKVEKVNDLLEEYLEKEVL